MQILLPGRFRLRPLTHTLKAKHQARGVSLHHAWWLPLLLTRKRLEAFPQLSISISPSTLSDWSVYVPVIDLSSSTMASVDETMHGCMLICMNTSVLAEPPTFAAAVPTHDSATSQAARGHQESTLLAAFFQDVLLDLSTYLRLVVFLPPSSVTSATTSSR